MSVPEVDVAAFGRRAAKAAARSIFPRSWLIWHGSRRSEAKRIALTFDDGPTELTSRYLEVLDAYRAPATFFVVGAWCARYPWLVDEMVRRGHEVAGHGYSHRTFTSLGKEELQAELERTEAMLPPNSYGRRYVRPPRGALSICSLATCANMGFTTVLWSKDSDDWRIDDADRLVDAFGEDSVQRGEIILFHEGQRWTLEALPRVLDGLLEGGFELATVSRLFDN